MNSSPIILASSSTTRQTLLKRLGLSFTCVSPDIDESAQNEVHADQLAKRLAFEKAAIVSKAHPDAIVIGSDQVAWFEHEPTHFIGKPLTTARAIQQLVQSSGQTLCFSTGLSIQHQSIAFEHTLVEHFVVTFRQLELAEIERYVAQEQPLYSAGSFHAEGLGITLFERMHGNDPTSLLGLPLIQVSQILRQLHITLP